MGKQVTLARPRRVLSSVLCWIFFFKFCFLFLKKKKKSLYGFSLGRFVAITAPPGGGEFR